MSDNGDPGWSLSEGTKFFRAYAQYGPKWHAVAAEVGTKDASACEALFLAHTTYLSLPPQYQHEVAFVAMVSDQNKQSVVRERESDDTVSEDATRGTSAPRFAKARRTPRAGSAGRGGGGPPARSPGGVFTPGGRRRAGAAASEPAVPAAWGGRGKRGAAVPVVSPESSALKRKRVQARLQFGEDGGVLRRGLRNLDDGDADGADALLSLAVLASDSAAAAAAPAPNPGRRVSPAKPAPGSRRPRSPLPEPRKRARPAEPPPRSPPSAKETEEDSDNGEMEPEAEPEPVLLSPGGRPRRRRVEPSALRDMHREDAEDGAAARNRAAEAGERRGRSASAATSEAPDGQERAPPPPPLPPPALRPRPQRARAAAAPKPPPAPPAGASGSGADASDSGAPDTSGAPEPAPKAESGAATGGGGGPTGGGSGGGPTGGGGGRRRAAPRRQRRRKSAPEKLHPMMSRIKSLFGRRGGGGLLLGVPGVPAGMGGALSSSPTAASPLPGIILPGMEGDESNAPRAAELQLRHCLDARTRRWVAAEFFCSAIDRPWFLHNPLQGLLAHLSIPERARLARAERSALRAVLGRPRRLSLAFLREERAALEAWRERARAKYEQLGYGREVPPDYPRQLQVSQRVTARHPVTRQLHDGDVLTVAPSCYRIQFDRRELAVELVKDVDVMPLDPTQLLQAELLEAPYVGSLVLNGRRAAEGFRRPPGAPGAGAGPWGAVAGGGGAPGGPARGPAAGRAQQAARAAQAQRSEADVKALVEVTGVLDRKEELLAGLHRMNDEVEAGLHVDPATGRHCAAFQASYARVVLELKQVNEVLEAALVQLQARNNPHAAAAVAQALQKGSSPAPAPLATAGGGALGVGGPSGTTPQQAAVQAAFEHARKLVMAQGGSTLRAGAGEGAAAEEGAPGAAAAPGGVAAVAGRGYREGSQEATWLLDLMAGCVAVLLTVHNCAESSAPNAVVAGSIEAAMAPLTPRAPANRPVFAAVRRTVDVLKQQLVAPSG
ncbi:hypothetical protein WJX81_003256 [Elliptochloris bilobata]|uniref:DIRP domain-containing protein n=1 Tax=Elliptochloris bilobata TaxID=381761 RepID=A0AAW1RNU7_9CHLO